MDQEEVFGEFRPFMPPPLSLGNQVDGVVPDRGDEEPAEPGTDERNDCFTFGNGIHNDIVTVETPAD